MTFRRRRRWFWSLAVVAALPLGGALYEALAVRRDTQRFPPPGILVNIGGRRLHLVCIGTGSPIVIFEHSAFGNSLSSEAARTTVASRARVCSYDRVGTGWSDAGPRGASAGTLAADLAALLDSAQLEPPYVLGPASMGGLPIELFARRYPERVAGLVWVDAMHSSILDRFLPNIGFAMTESACLVRIAARIGVLRLWDPFGVSQLPPDAAALSTALTYRASRMDTLCSMFRRLPVSARELQSAAPLSSSIPLTVLVHDRPDNLVPPGFERQAAPLLEAWRSMQQQFANRSHGEFRVVPGSDHLIGNSAPQAVAEAIVEMVER